MIEELAFHWDNTINISGRLYPQRISNNNELGVFETIKYTAKELIKIEIYSAKKEIAFCEKERTNLQKLESKYQRIKKFNKIYQKDIEPIDFLGMFDGDELDIIHEDLKYKFINKEEDLAEKIKYIAKDIRTKTFIIKRICLENISLILKIDGVKNFKTASSHLLSKNNIEIDDKKKHNIYQINHYKQIHFSCKLSYKY